MFFFILFNWFIYFWLCRVYIAGLALLSLWRLASLSLQRMRFSPGWLLLLQSVGSRQAGFSSRSTWVQQFSSWALERGLSSCAAWAQLLHGTWDLPRPGIESVSAALADGFFTTEPPRKPMHWLFLYKWLRPFLGDFSAYVKNLKICILFD